jgi:hypothetical protein
MTVQGRSKIGLLDRKVEEWLVNAVRQVCRELYMDNKDTIVPIG